MKQKKYSHVIVVGVDGAGAFFKDADTPNFDRIFENGSVTYRALASNPTISAECWGSMLIGVGPEIHKLTNAIVAKDQYKRNAVFPSLFRRIYEAYPDSELGSFCEWDSITRGIIERNVPITVASDHDTVMTPNICKFITKRKPTFLFVQMDSVDHAGHHDGYQTPAYLKRISEVDALINDIYVSVEKAGMKEDTLFIVISDHGGNITSHGGWSDAEKYVTFAAIGKNIVKGEPDNMNIRDLSAIVLYALGIDAPAFDESGWTSQIPQNLFEDPAIPAYRDISHLTGAEPRISKAPHQSELI
ncbi:MAG: alkaline phosphatase [Ruminococcaceae bacterium]|nr:alkaline phosphatase [Oscillospiraceae bacterium]